MKKISRLNVKSKIQAQGNKIMSCTFKKADGQSRQMNFRLGVHLGKTLGPNKTMSDERTIVTVYDMNTGGYRNINVATMTELKISGDKYEIV